MTKESCPPHIVVFRTNGQVKGIFVAADGVYVECGESSISAGILVLLACYYVFNMDYPRIYCQLLGILQTHLIRQIPYAGPKSSKYSKFSTKMMKAIGEVEKARELGEEKENAEESLETEAGM